MKKMLMMLSVLLLSVSCVDLNGTLQVQQPLTVKMKSMMKWIIMPVLTGMEANTI